MEQSSGASARRHRRAIWAPSPWPLSRPRRSGEPAKRSRGLRAEGDIENTPHRIDWHLVDVTGLTVTRPKGRLLAWWHIRRTGSFPLGYTETRTPADTAGSTGVKPEQPREVPPCSTPSGPHTTKGLEAPDRLLRVGQADMGVGLKDQNVLVRANTDFGLCGDFHRQPFTGVANIESRSGTTRHRGTTTPTSAGTGKSRFTGSFRHHDSRPARHPRRRRVRWRTRMGQEPTRRSSRSTRLGTPRTRTSAEAHSSGGRPDRPGTQRVLRDVPRTSRRRPRRRCKTSPGFNSDPQRANTRT